MSCTNSAAPIARVNNFYSSRLFFLLHHFFSFIESDKIRIVRRNYRKKKALNNIKCFIRYLIFGTENSSLKNFYYFVFLNYESIVSSLDSLNNKMKQNKIGLTAEC